MLCLALTGGIATGKSTFARHFRSLEPLTAFFDCDASVDTLLTTPSVATTISQVLGSNLLDANGALIRSRLREKVFQNPDARKLLEEILHPMVRNLCQQALNAARASNAEGAAEAEVERALPRTRRAPALHAHAHDGAL
jgi:dephospho-CoA kinase